MVWIFVTAVFLVAVFFAARAHKEGRWNFRDVGKRATTWIGLANTAAGSAILVWSSAPDDMKVGPASNLGGWLLIGMMVLGVLVMVANSIQQKSLRK